MENRFYVGQEVLCIKTQSQGLVVKGNRYTITAIKAGVCKCSPVLVNVDNMITNAWSIICGKCNAQLKHMDGLSYFHCALFIPIDNTKSELTANEVMEEIEIGELLKSNLWNTSSTHPPHTPHQLLRHPHSVPVCIAGIYRLCGVNVCSQIRGLNSL